MMEAGVHSDTVKKLQSIYDILRDGESKNDLLLLIYLQ